jgi:NAD(P)H-nitrite reductase large subunit
MPGEAIIQRDGKIYAITVRFSGGFVTPGDLEKIAAVARDHAIPVIKLTSAQRFLLAGILKKDMPDIWEDLGRDPVRDHSPLREISPGLYRECLEQVRGAGFRHN